MAPPTRPKHPPPPPPPELKDIPDVKEVVESGNAFTTVCSRELRLGIPGNLVYSSFYLRIMLGMAKLGARGETQEEIQNAFNFFPKDSTFSHGVERILSEIMAHNHEGIHISESTRFFIKKGFEITMEFAEELFDLYKTEIIPMDFSEPLIAANLINSWFERATDSQIEFVVNPKTLNQYTRLLLINAIHFRGEWKEKFDRKLTKKGIFYIKDQKHVEVDMMVKKTNVSYGNFPDLNSHVIVLPYMGDRLHLMIILPKSQESLSHLKKELNPVSMFEKIAANQVSMEIMLPKFTIENTLHLIQPLKQLGVKSMFDPFVANFSGITGYEMDDFYMTDIIQKVIFECAEDDGKVVVMENKKAAATARVNKIGPKGKPIHFHADRPFLFILIDKVSGAILFSGTCANPTTRS